MANVIKHKRGSGSDPAANNLVLGELAIRTDVGKLFTKMDSGAIAEIAGGGSDIAINTLSSSSATGGGSATFNGSAYRFTLSAPPSVSAQQLLVSINGVIQKPVAGTGQPSEGFSVSGNDIILGDAPATGADFFILTFKSLGVSEPADNSVTSAKIVDGAIVNADINASAAIAGSKISPNFGSQAVSTTGDLTIDTNTLKVDSSNNRVGIGVSSPDVELDINGDASSNTQIRLRKATTGNYIAIKLDRDASGTAGGQLGISGTSGHFVTTSSQHDIILRSEANLLFGIGQSEKMRIDTSGNIGIGTTSPQNMIHTSAANDSSGIRMTNTYDTPDNVWALLPAISGVSNTGFCIRDVTDGVNRLVIDGSGKVGINTTSPVGKLTVDENNASEHFQLRNTTNTSNFSAFGVDSSFNLRIYTNGSNERMRIDSSGFVGIGTTTANKNLVVKRSGNVVVAGIEASAASAVNLDLSSSISTGRAFFFRFLYNGNITGNVYSDGSTTVYNTGSDYRLKENVVGISDGITRLKALKPSRFNFKRDSSTTVDGFLAHEVSSIVPEAISGTKDEVATEDNEETGVKKGDPIYQGIDQSKLVPLLTAALQEAIVRIEALEAG